MTFREFLMEGTWETPNTLQKAKRLVSVLNSGIKAKDTRKLRGVIGDDDLFDEIDEIDDNDDVGELIKIWVKDTWLDKMSKINWTVKWDDEAVNYLKKNIK